MNLDVLHHPRREGFTFDPSRIYEQRDRASFKPNGLWLSVDDDWRRWCTDEEWGGDWFEHPEVHFQIATDRCLWLKTPEDFVPFTNEYADSEGYYITWNRVAEVYAGIIIAPYQWTHRLSLTVNWYYPWDCASACVWDLSAIKVKAAVSA